MKNLASASFFRLFDLMVNTTNPGLKSSHWTYSGVEWVRNRYSMTSQMHDIIIEIFTLTRPGRRHWSLMVTKEHWWAGAKTEAIKSVRWARPVGGRRTDIMEWLRERERELDRGILPNPSQATSADTIGSTITRS